MLNRKNRKIASFSMSLDLLERLKDEATKMGISQSALIAVALNDFFKKNSNEEVIEEN